jgi:hypothetical protein
MRPWSGKSHHAIVIHLLKAARGVYPVGKTFHNDWLQLRNFDAWVNGWEQNLAADELALWRYMQEQRHWDEHGDGADLVPHTIPVEIDDQFVSGALLGLGTDAQPRASKGSVRFGKCRNRKLSDVCQDYLTLCQRFVTDFLADPVHAAIIGPPGTGAASAASPDTTTATSP